ncbi:MAG TPA: 3-dehydroquinate synthase family protein [Acidimicrobiales bacterium]
MSEPIRVPVLLGERSYDVVVGPGAVTSIGELLPERSPRVAVVTQRQIGIDLDPGRPHEVFTIGDGEAAKSLVTVEDLCRRWARWGLSRGDVVVGVGGGVVTDVAGFAAASFHRGVPVVHVATSLLGMVDAAIGGKTGVNLPEGKNLVGAFWQPRGVICDIDHLSTLPEAEWRCGLGEVAKYHFLGGDGIDVSPGGDLTRTIARCVEIKAGVVAADEREGGRRAVLNYGHTLAHALETLGGYDLRHGEAVAIGLLYAACLARRLGRIDDGRVQEHRRVVVGYHLPTAVPEGLDPDAIVELFGRDKKAVDGLTLALDGPSGVEVVTGVDPGEARAALDDLAELTASTH